MPESVTVTFSEFFNKARVLKHELEREARRKIAFQNILTVAYEQRAAIVVI